MTPAQLGALKALARTTHRQPYSALHPAKDLSIAPPQLLAPLLNGVPAAAVSRILGRTRRRADGIYFSGADWTKLVAVFSESER